MLRAQSRAGNGRSRLNCRPRSDVEGYRPYCHMPYSEPLAQHVTRCIGAPQVTGAARATEGNSLGHIEGEGDATRLKMPFNSSVA
jgi:hypothetical protein